MAFSLEAVFGVDSSGMDKGLKEAEGKTENFAGKVADKVADKLTGMRDISNAIATALGINYEKIAENVARFVTGASEVEVEALKKIVEESDKTTELVLKSLEKRRSNQQNINEISNDEERIRKQIAKNSEEQASAQAAITAAVGGMNPLLAAANKLTGGWFLNTVATKEQTVLIAEAAKLTGQLQELSAKKQELITKESEETKKIQDETRSIVEETLPLEMQLVEHKKRAAEYAAIIASATGQGAEKDKARLSLAEENNAIQKITIQLSKEHYATQEKLYKLKFDQLPAEEKIETYTRNIEVLSRAIRDAKLQHKNTDELQVELMTNKVELEKLIKDQAAQRLEVEKNTTEELRRQAEQEAAKLRAAQMFISVTRVGSGYESQSTDALKGVESRLQNQLGAIGPNGMPIALATAQSDYGSFLQRTTYENELANVRRELQSRSEIQAYAQRYGEGAARSQYGDSATNNALRDMQSSTTRTAQATETVAEQLAALNRKLGINPTI